MQGIQRLLVSVMLLMVSSTLWASSSFYRHQVPASERRDVKQFIQTMVDKHQFDKVELTNLFQHVKFDPSVIAKMNKPSESKPWYIYRSRFVTEKRTQEGVAFWKEHKQELKRAEKQYGVPASIIIAIIGVESNYGQVQGNFPVLNTLATFAFNYPRRAEFFRSELEHYLLLTRELHINPATLVGSYAGAMGQGQFMPSSYRRYAVDFSGKKLKDLFEDSADAIGSVANYFHEHGWRPGQAIATPAQVHGSDYQAFVSDRKKVNEPTVSLSRLASAGIQATLPTDEKTKAVLIKLEGKQQPEFYLGFENFYVLTRYNTSPLYAMAVTELSQAIDQLLKEQAS